MKRFNVHQNDTVNSSPGTVASELWNIFPEDARNAMFDAAKQKLPVGHVGTPEQLAEAYLFAMKVLCINCTIKDNTDSKAT
jgi:NAD(P)-dependent dehydrogenase (short-subunit alcohol dehydrogenase family)